MEHTVSPKGLCLKFKSTHFIIIVDGTLIGRNKTVILLHGSIVSFVSCHLSKL